jgi:hypothetical protein
MGEAGLFSGGCYSSGTPESVPALMDVADAVALASFDRDGVSGSVARQFGALLLVAACEH